MNTNDAVDVNVTQKRPGVAAPTTVSGAVRRAIADGRALLEAGECAFDAATWLSDGAGGSCSVCAAGAVMARQFDTAGRSGRPWDFDEPWKRALTAINAVREECFQTAFSMLYPERDEENAAGVFADTVWARLSDHGYDPHKAFASAEAYTHFLDRLEGVTLPAVEHAEDTIARRTRLGTLKTD